MDKCTVFVENGIKKLRSKVLNYDFNLENGFTKVWGETEEDNPEYSPFGCLIADIEITEKCAGIGKEGILCPYCYKSNTHDGKSMSFETFKKVVSKINTNGQLQQVAFGLGAQATENPELWDMCKWLRQNNIIPNGTVADVIENSAVINIAKYFGAVAVSYHNDFEILANNVLKFSPAIFNKEKYTLRQINIHFVIMEETFEDCKKLFKMVKEDKRFLCLNAIVLLGLKKCGRAENGNFHRLTDEHFKELVNLSFENKIGIGFDSCSCNRFLSAVKDFPNYKELEELSEPCESKLYSQYINTEGKAYYCSFNEKNREGFDLLADNDFISDYWNNNSDNWREMLKNSNRSCPVYEV
jgi:hypothetical protein